MKILLMGNPNVGKSVVFSRLTGVHVISSNYPGTTVEFTKGFMYVDGKKAEVIDVPGTYSLVPTSEAEKVAKKMFLNENPDVVVVVVDSTNLERNLYLTLQILEAGVPTVLALNMWDLAKRKGIHIDVEKLKKELGIEVVPIVAITGEGIKDLVSAIKKTIGKKVKFPKMKDEERWAYIGNLISKVQSIEHKHPGIVEILEDATLHPIYGIIIALIIMYITIKIVVNLGGWIGDNIIGYFFEEYYGPFIKNLIGNIFPHGILHNILIGEHGDFMESFGILTTGLYVPFAVVLPYVLLFYLILGFLEDVGYLPRLAVMADTIMHKIGLHGAAIIPAILGIGCNVPSIISTRILENKKERFIAATLTAISIPCMAQTAIIIGLLGKYGLKYVAIVYVTLIMLYLTLGYGLNKSMRGECPEIFLEIPPYRIPHIPTLLKKTWFRVYSFLIEAVPFMLLGIIIINILYYLGIISFLSKLLAPILSGLFGLPPQSVEVLIVGFLRKDVAMAMLAPLHLSPTQLTVASIVLATYFPCVATFVILLKELGLKDMLKVFGIMVLVTLSLGTLLNVLLHFFIP